MAADREIGHRDELDRIGEAAFRRKWTVTERHRAERDPDLRIALAIIGELDHRDLREYREKLVEVEKRGTRWSGWTAIFTLLIAIFTFLLVVVAVM